MDVTTIAQSLDATTMGVLLNIATFVVGGVWAVGKVKETTAVLSNAISNLEKSVEKLDKTIGAVQEAHNGIIQRVAILEERTR